MDRTDEEIKPLNPLSQEQSEQEVQDDDMEKIVLTISSIIFNSLLGWLFYSFSSNPDKYGGEECHYLRPLGISFAFYCFLSLAISIILNPFIIWHHTPNLLKLFDLINILEGIFRLIFFLLFCITFVIATHCASLRWLTAIYIIINFIVFTISCCLTQMEKLKHS